LQNDPRRKATPQAGWLSAIVAAAAVSAAVVAMSGIKRKKATVGSPANKKLAGSIESLMARLEKSNASFLQQAATSSMQTQLAQVKVRLHAFTSQLLACSELFARLAAHRLLRLHRQLDVQANAACWTASTLPHSPAPAGIIRHSFRH
jgi:hypothetical protein